MTKGPVEGKREIPPVANATEHEWTQDEIDEEMFRDDDDEDGGDGWEECGRWNNGRLSHQCRKAGSEECDWECPIGLGGKL